jgi:hypothetical protein
MWHAALAPAAGGGGVWGNMARVARMKAAVSSGEEECVGWKWKLVESRSIELVPLVQRAGRGTMGGNGTPITGGGEGVVEGAALVSVSSI